MNENKSLVIISLMRGFSWGGSEELWFSTAIYSLKNGDEVNIFIKEWPKDHDKILYLRTKGAKIHYIEERYQTKNGFIDWLFLKSKKKREDVFAQVNFDKVDKILISQGDTFSAFCSPIILGLLNLKKPIYLISQHLSDTGIPSDELKKISSQSLDKIKKFLFVSKRSLELTKRYLNNDGNNFMLVNNPVNLKKKNIIEYPKDIVPSFGVVARLDCRFKGQDILLEVLNNEKWKSREWVCNLYGNGVDFAYLNNLISTYNLKERVFIRGHNNSVEDIWKRNHILILPSISEGTPLSLVEANICGRIAVGTDVGGISEIIQDNVTGWIAEAPLTHYLDNAMERAWKDIDKWEGMGQLAHQLALKRYSNDAGEELYNIIFDD